MKKFYIVECGDEGADFELYRTIKCMRKLLDIELYPIDNVMEVIQLDLNSAAFPVDEEGLSIDCISVEFAQWIVSKRLRIERID